MSQPIQHQSGSRSRRSKSAMRLKRGLLSVVRRPSSDGLPAFLAIWHGDADVMSPRHSRLSDWPRHEDFEPLIAAAMAAGNDVAVAQLIGDREYCGAMHAKLLSDLNASKRRPPKY